MIVVYVFYKKYSRKNSPRYQHIIPEDGEVERLQSQAEASKWSLPLTKVGLAPRGRRSAGNAVHPMASQYVRAGSH